MTKAELIRLDALYTAFCNENGIAMDSDADRADYADREHIYSEPTS